MPRVKSETLLIHAFYFFISFFFLIYLIGWSSLNPFNLDWLLTNDQVGELIGWLNFKNSKFLFPFGSFEKPGLGTSSIIYHGTIPLFAIFFKTFFSYLDNFQYFSIWIFFCIYLQGFLSFLILKKFINENYICLLSSIFFIISPIFIYRIGIHLSLAAHWLILLYFLNYLSKGKNYHLNNLLIIVLSSGIHFYFTAILFIINTIYYFFSFKKLFFIKFIFLNLFTLSLFMFLLGYFVLPPQDVIGYGYGIYKLNLLSIFDPGTITMGNKIQWSYFLPDIYSNYGEHEGFNYLGLGIILIFLTSFAYFLKNFSNYKKKENNIIIFIGIFLFILAISNNIHFGKFNIISFELNKFIYGLLGMIRASGRLFWPIYYVIIIFSIIFIYQKFKTKSLIIISFFLVLQFIDLMPGFKSYEFGKLFFKDRKILKDNIWSKIDDEFKIISQTFVENQSNDFFKITQYLVNSKIKSEIFYSARYNRKKMTELRYKNYNDLYNGNLEDKIFIISSTSHLNHLKNLYLNRKDIKFVNRDNVWMLFKSNLIDNKSLEIEKFNQIKSKKISINKKINIKFPKSPSENSFLGMGWEKYNNDLKPWTDGANASLIFELPSLDLNKEHYLEMEFESKPDIKDEIINLKIFSSGLDKNYEFNFKNNLKKIKLKLNNINKKNKILILDFKLSGMISEFERFISPDERLIGLKLNSIKLVE
tara:strand:+ start:1410 stop:3515 length:2106 start_codon:yes stop_codon:yes gene_type:complete